MEVRLFSGFKICQEDLSFEGENLVMKIITAEPSTQIWLYEQFEHEKCNSHFVRAENMEGVNSKLFYLELTVFRNL